MQAILRSEPRLLPRICREEARRRESGIRPASIGTSSGTTPQRLTACHKRKIVSTIVSNASPSQVTRPTLRIARRNEPTSFAGFARSSQIILALPRMRMLRHQIPRNKRPFLIDHIGRTWAARCDAIAVTLFIPNFKHALEENARSINGRERVGLPHRLQKEQEVAVEQRQVVGERHAFSTRCSAEAHLPDIA